MEILYIVVIMIMRVVQSCFSKQSSLLLSDGIAPYTRYIITSKFFAACFSAITLLSIRNFSGFDAQTLIIASLSGLALTAGSVCGIIALKSGTIVLNSIFGTAGLIVPCILGVFFFNERMSVIQVICIGVLLISAYMLISSSKKIYNTFSVKTLLVLMGTLLANGLTMFFQKLFAYRLPNGNVSLFSFLTFFVPVILLAVFSLFLKPLEKEQEKYVFPKQLTILAAVLAFAVFVINQLATMAASFMSSAVLFAFINGGGTIIAAIVGAILFKEKLTVKSSLGIIIGIFSLICIKIY